MKKILITLSLLANAAILVALLSPATFNRIVPFAGLDEGVAPSTAPGASIRSTNRTPSRTSTAASAGVAVSPGALLGGTPADLVARLRAAGLPDTLVRSIVSMHLNAEVAAKRRQWMSEFPEVPYWKATGSSLAMQALSAAQTAELREMSMSNARLLAQLLGPASMSGLSGTFQTFQFGNLPSDKVSMLQMINQDYSALSQQVRGTSPMSSIVTLPEEREQLAFLEQEKDKDIRALLSPEEYEDYMFRTSSTGNTLRNTLQYFNPTEAEFRALYALQHEFNMKYNPPGGSVMVAMTPELSRQRATDQQQLTAAMKTVIPPERLEEYEMTTDGNYRQLRTLATRLDMPTVSVNQAWQIQRDLQAQANAIRSDRTLAQNPQARNERLKALQDEATAQLTTALGGARNFEAYKSYGGQWIQSLVPQAAPPAAGGGGAVPMIRAF